MKAAKIAFSLALAVVILLGSSQVAAAQGPIDDAPPQSIEPQTFVSATVSTAIQRSFESRQGPAPCLNEGGGFSHIPAEVILSGPIK